MPPSSWPDCIDWRNSFSRSILLDDLFAVMIPMEGMHAEDIWEIYKGDKIFIREGVVFSQFKERLNGHKKQVARSQCVSKLQKEALLHDLALRMWQDHDSVGRPYWHTSAAKTLLQEDVRNKLHQMMPPSKLRELRPEYMAFSLDIFCTHIYQEVRDQKFNHYCEMKRIKKEEKDNKKHKKLARGRK